MSKVVFQLDRDEDGYPPVGVEMLNADPLGDGLYRIRNAPFFTENISYNDVVRAAQTEIRGQYQFEEVI